MNPWLLVAGGLVGWKLLSSSSAGSTPAGGREWTDEDIEYLARVLIMETGLARDPTEMVGIAWVAVNRALGKKKSIRQVVATTSWPGGGARGNSFVEAIQMDRPGRTSSNLHSAPVGHPNIGKARELAKNVLRGSKSNPIGPRKHFVHPSGLPGSLPSWVVSKSAGGAAEFEPLKVAGALFAGAEGSNMDDGKQGYIKVGLALVGLGAVYLLTRPSRRSVEGLGMNPLHDRAGRFTNEDGILNDDGGSASLGTEQYRLSVVGGEIRRQRVEACGRLNREYSCS